MEQQFVTYETALKLKELGFDEPCVGYWISEKGFVIEQSHSSYRKLKLHGYIVAPLYQQVIDWFREKYGIHIDLDFGLGWGYGFIPVGTELTYNWNHFEDGHKWSYYEAREQSILNTINQVE